MEFQRFYKKVTFYKLTYFLVKNTKYKATQPLCVMELQRFNKKVKLFKLTYFLVKNTKYKAIQPLCGMELQIFNKKETAETCIFPHCHTHLKLRLF